MTSSCIAPGAPVAACALDPLAAAPDAACTALVEAMALPLLRHHRLGAFLLGCMSSGFAILHGITPVAPAPVPAFICSFGSMPEYCCRCLLLLYGPAERSRTDGSTDPDPLPGLT